MKFAWQRYEAAVQEADFFLFYFSGLEKLLEALNQSQSGSQ